MLREGEVVGMGPLDETLTGQVLTDAFGLPLAVERRPDGRLAAWAR